MKIRSVEVSIRSFAPTGYRWNWRTLWLIVLDHSQKLSATAALTAVLDIACLGMTSSARRTPLHQRLHPSLSIRKSTHDFYN